MKYYSQVMFTIVEVDYDQVLKDLDNAIKYGFIRDLVVDKCVNNSIPEIFISYIINCTDTKKTTLIYCKED